MNKFIFLSLIFMGWAFYELSGGQDFEPPVGAAKVAEATVDADTTTKPEAARAAMSPSVAGMSVAKREPVGPAAATPGDAQVVKASLPSTSTQKATKPNIGEGSLRVVSLSERPALDAERHRAAAEAAAIAAQREVRLVTGNRVNMRNGPGTEYSVLDRLTRGEQVEILAEPGNGWVKLRVKDTGRVGWMADFLLASAE